MTRRCGSSKPSPTPLPCEANILSRRKNAKAETTNEEHKTGKWVQKTPANGGINTLERYHFPQISKGNGAREKGRREICTESRNKKNAKTLGSKAEESKTSRANPKRSGKKRTRTRNVQNPTRARGMDIVPHPAWATPKPGGELPEKSPQEH